MTQKPDLRETQKAVQKGVDKYLAKRGMSLKSHPKQTVAIGRAFTEFYIRDIAYHTDDLSDEQMVQRGLECDAPGDLGVDFVYEQPETEDEPEYWIFQSKYSGTNSFKKEDISDFFQIHTRICNPTEMDVANPNVQLALKGFSEQSAAVFVLLTNAEMFGKLKAEFERQKQAQMADPKWKNFSWRLVSLSEIQDNYGHVKSLDKPPSSVDVPIQSLGTDSGKGFIDMSSKIAGDACETFVTAINGADLAEIWQELGASLFNRNIRGFLGQGGSKNKNIQKTLQDTPELFYLYNNGISAICSDMSERGGGTALHCKEFQIINGAQTVCSIGEFAEAEAAKKGKGKLDNLKKVWVLARITQTDDHGLNKDIITYNNTQNAIRDADFNSNDDVQVFLQDSFKERELQYHGGASPKPLIYKPKRMDSPSAREGVIITMEDAAKSLFAFMTEEPTKMNSQTKFLFEKSAKKGGVYWEIFGLNKKEVPKLPSNDVTRIAAILALNRFLNDQTTKLKQEKVKKDGKPVDKYPSDTMEGMAIRSGRHILWAFGFVIREFYPGEEDKIYGRILGGGAFAEGDFVRSWFENIKRAMIFALSSERGDGKELNFKMWLRDKEKLENVRNALRLIHGKPVSADGLFDAPQPTKGGKR